MLFKRNILNILIAAKDYVDIEKAFLNRENVDLVIGDIPPFPFIAAKELNILTIGISNFTWYTAYSGFLSKEERKSLLEAYKKMDYFFELAGGREPEWGKQGNFNVEFFSREADKNEVNRIKDQLNPLGDKRIVYFGLGMKINVKTLASFKMWTNEECVFIVSSNTEIKGDNIVKIPNEYSETQNFIAASDLVISKPGWGTVGEAVQNNIPLLIIKRKMMKEDQNTIDYLMEHQLCELIEWEALASIDLEDYLSKEKNSLKLESSTMSLDGMIGKIGELINGL